MNIIESIENTSAALKNISSSISQIEFGEHTVLKIDHVKCKAAISLQGGHLLYWQPSSERTPVIWLSDSAIFKKGTAIRGGVPICWPWFSNMAKPSHGFARIADWQLKSHKETQQCVEIVLSLKSNEWTHQYLKNDFELELYIRLSDTCEIDLSCQGDIEATSALHTYFNVSDINNVTVTGLGQQYYDKLSTINEPAIIGEMQFNQEVDRIYSNAKSINLIKDKDRTIIIEHRNYSDVVVWNPWSEQVKNIADLQDDSYLNFVCVETARINHPIKSTLNQKQTFGIIIQVI